LHAHRKGSPQGELLSTIPAKPQAADPFHGPANLDEDPLLTDFDLERLTGRARSTWQKARLLGTGPRFIRLGRLVRYRTSEYNAWLAKYPSLRSTSESQIGVLPDKVRP
jgi:predicted DNA-binding transcriptional regulator AlpA